MTLPDEPSKDVPSIAITETPYQGNVVDTRKDSINTLSTYVSGQKWKVDAYLQVLGKDDAANTHSDDILAIYRQLRLVRGLTVMVTQDLQSRQSSEPDKHFEVTGSSDVPHGVTPNLGDIFVADIGDGRNAILTITSSERASFYQESLTSVEYRVVGYLDNEKQRNLDSKVIQTLYYDEEYLRSGLNPLITEQVVEDRRTLRELYSVLVTTYFRSFFSNKYKTFILPGQDGTTYDPYLTKFIKAIVDHEVYPYFHDVTIYSTNEDVYTVQNTIWELFLRGDMHMLPLLSKVAGIAPRRRYRTRPLFNGIYFSGIEAVVTMTDVPFSHDTAGMSNTVIGGLSKAGVRVPTVSEIMPILDLRDHTPEIIQPTKELPIITRIVEGDYYIFSNEFYDEGKPGSLLEKLVLTRLEDGDMDVSDLTKVVKNSLKFNNLERFYYVPILLALIKLADGVI